MRARSWRPGAANPSTVLWIAAACFAALLWAPLPGIAIEEAAQEEPPSLDPASAEPESQTVESASLDPASADSESQASESQASGASPLDEALRVEAQLSAEEAEEVRLLDVWPMRLDALEVNGLWRTKRFVVERELPWRLGEEVTEEAWEQGLTRLWSMGVFSRVEGRVEERGDERVAVLDLEERWTIMVMAQFGGGGGAFWLRTGVYDINTLGRYFETGVLYERFQKYNGAQVWTRIPRLFDERQELYLALDRMVRPRPDYSLIRAGAHAEYSRQLNDHFILGARVEALWDLFGAPLEGEGRRPEESRTGQLSGWLRLGRAEPVRLLARGWQMDFRPLLGVSDFNARPVFAQLSAEALAYRILHPRVGLAARFMGGVSTPTQEQHRFFIGGLDMLRGYKDNHAQGHGYALANVELRVVAFDSTWLAILPVAFVDAGLVADADRGLTPMASAGLGLRGIVPRLYRSGVRLDFPVPLAPLSKPGIAFGVYQFFGP